MDNRQKDQIKKMADDLEAHKKVLEKIAGSPQALTASGELKDIIWMLEDSFERLRDLIEPTKIKICNQKHRR